VSNVKRWGSRRIQAGILPDRDVRQRKQPFGCENEGVKEAPVHFPKRLLKDVRTGLSQRGFHVLGRDELYEICGIGRSGSEKLHRVHLFATQCDAQCEIGLDFAAARLLPKKFANSQLASLMRIGSLRLA
jgi:hypothetical protein